jgi:hypothetical protein
MKRLLEQIKINPLNRLQRYRFLQQLLKNIKTIF